MKSVFRVLLTVLSSLILLSGCSANTPTKPVSQEQQGAQQKAPVPVTATVPTSVVPTVPSTSLKALPVLYYHSVLIEPGNELRMPPEQFSEQMDYLFVHGYHSITPEELEQFLSGQGELPIKPFMITFDDGYADNYLNALPILQKYKFTATVFMVSSYIDGEGFLSLEQLHKLVAAGWTIGDHTSTHVDLTKLDSDSIEKELRDSQALLEKDLGEPVKYFCYPYGAYNSEIKKLLLETGFSLAFSTERGWAVRGSDPLLIHRVYCFANMGMTEFERRLQNPKY